MVLPIDQIGTATSVSAGTGAFSESGIAYYSPQFTDAEQMAEPLQAALGESVVVAVYPEENRIMIKGSPEDLRIASQAIQQLNVPRAQIRITAMIYDVSLGELDQLDRIPHAQTALIIPCCKDPDCADHHPRPRPNLGSYSLEMLGGVGMETNQIITSDSFEATGEPVFITPRAVESESLQSAPVEQAPIDPALIEPIPFSKT